MRGNRAEVDATVVIAAWNAAAFIRRAVESALAQERVSLEVVVVDDGSTDGTAEAVAAIGDGRIRVIRQEQNLGPGAARNRALSLARGRWIAVQDADDGMAPDRIAAMLEVGDTAGADVVVDDLLEVSPEGESLGVTFGERLEGIDRLDLAQFILANRVFGNGPNLGYMKPVFRRSFLDRHDLRYDRALRIGEDYALLADCLAAGASVAVVRKALYRYTRRHGSLSHRLDEAHVRAMADADAVFARRWNLDRSARSALAKRATAFRDAAAFLAAVEALKRRDWLAALTTVARRPRATLLFRYPVRARLARTGIMTGRRTAP